ncbi:hypothetical protein EHF33_08880 [Deinococcus psychrotolerans]|uniref:NUDIX hydrolase n=2 Tax=Deinococcus TaxID=1298 RepID=A0A553V616_9DEIO|nr:MULTISPECIES: hypothetical protein [Deinococcus]AZI42850.1 hypothetical protein EHF33_08880 [Deinococcus psychrotolerans]TSA87923.1 hypothetical protein FNU79_01370 [Deinococcus detaillensis]
MTAARSSSALYYQVGVFGLIRSKDTYLTVTPHQPVLPGAVQLPGLLLTSPSGAGLAESGLRRALLSQVGLAVSALSVVASFAVRLPEGDSRLSLIFGSEYVSGILNPSSEVLGAQWLDPEELRRAGAPQWLFAAIREYEAFHGTPPSGGEERPRRVGLRSILGRRSE